MRFSPVNHATISLLETEQQVFYLFILSTAKRQRNCLTHMTVASVYLSAKTMDVPARLCEVAFAQSRAHARHTQLLLLCP